MPPLLPPLPDENDLAEILDLFKEHVYAGAIAPDGRYVAHRSGPKLARFLGGPVPAGWWEGLWESRVHPDDQAEYARFNRRLHMHENVYARWGVDAERNAALLWGWPVDPEPAE